MPLTVTVLSNILLQVRSDGLKALHLFSRCLATRSIEDITLGNEWLSLPVCSRNDSIGSECPAQKKASRIPELPRARQPRLAT